MVNQTRQSDFYITISTIAALGNCHLSLLFSIKDERLVIGIGHNRDLDRLLRLRSITIRCIDNRSTIIIAPITINLYVIIGIIGQNRCDYNWL